MSMKKRMDAIIFALIFAFVLIPVVGIVTFAETADQKPLTTYWTADSSVAQSLREYVEKVTDPTDKENFIPQKPCLIWTEPSPVRRITLTSIR